MAGNRLVDAALDIARRKPGSDDPANARRREMQHLEAGPGWQALGEERSKDLAGTLIGTDQRRDSKDKAL